VASGKGGNHNKEEDGGEGEDEEQMGIETNKGVHGEEGKSVGRCFPGE